MGTAADALLPAAPNIPQPLGSTSNKVQPKTAREVNQIAYIVGPRSYETVVKCSKRSTSQNYCRLNHDPLLPVIVQLSQKINQLLSPNRLGLFHRRRFLVATAQVMPYWEQSVLVPGVCLLMN